MNEPTETETGRWACHVPKYDCDLWASRDFQLAGSHGTLGDAERCQRHYEESNETRTDQ